MVVLDQGWGDTSHSGGRIIDKTSWCKCVFRNVSLVYKRMRLSRMGTWVVRGSLRQTWEDEGKTNPKHR